MEIQSNNIAQAKRDKLRKLLDSDGFDVLIEVLQSKAFENEVDVANAALEGTTGYDSKAKESARKAVVIHEGIAIIKELVAAKHFTISSAKPNTPNTKPAT